MVRPLATSRVSLPPSDSPTDDRRMREFRTDEDFLSWLAQHPDLYLVNAFRPPTPGYLVLHRADCEIFRRPPARGNSWVDTSTKVGGQREELEAWAATVGGALSECGACQP